MVIKITAHAIIVLRCIKNVSKKKYRKPRKPNEIKNLETKLDQNFLWFWENSFSKIKKHEVIFKIKKIIDNTF